MITAKIEMIDNIEKFARLASYVEKLQPEYVVLDCETNGLSEKTSLLYGIGLCFNEDYAFYFIWRNQDGSKVWTDLQEKQISNWLVELCKNSKLITHNGLFDGLIIENNLGVRISDYIHSDTLLLKHLIDEESPSGLKPTALRYLGAWADKAQQAMIESIKANGGRTTKENMDMFLASSEILGEYCCWDVLLTLKLFNLFNDRLYKEGLDSLFLEEVLPLYHVVIDMKRHGMPIDLPHFGKLKQDITKDINRLELEIMEEIEPHVGKFVKNLLDEEFAVNNKGNFPKVLAELLNIPMPITKEGKVTLAKKAIEQQKALNYEATEFYDWVVQGGPVPKNVNQKTVYAAQKRMFFTTNSEQKHVFNLKSNDHLSYLLCNCLGFKPLEKTPTGKNKIDDDFLDSIKSEDSTVQKLLDYKKLNKLSSTYIEGILDREINGIIYTSFLIHGTTSGRWSSRNPNLQNLPRKKEGKEISIVDKYTNAIRQGFIAGKGYKIVDCDYSALEPRCFSSVTEDKGLLELWEKGEDLYSRIAIDTFKLTGISANPKDINYLKKVDPEFRQKAKTFCLAVPYGAEASRIAEAMKISYGEAQVIINSYLNAYPGLKKYMIRSNYDAKTHGQVVTKFGRVRHLTEAQTLHKLYGDQLLDYKWANSKGLIQERRIYKNCLNNAKNVKIQGLAAHILNRAVIAIHKEFKTRNLDAYIGLSIHDQIVCVAREDLAEEVKLIMKDKMENTTKLNVKLLADPEIADNLAESH